MKRSEIFFSIFLVPFDFLMLLAGFSLAYYLRDSGLVLTPNLSGDLARVVDYGINGQILPFANYLRYILYIAPVMLAIFGLTGLYAMRGKLPWSKRIVRIFIGVSVGLFFILLLFLLRNDFFLPRSTVLYAWIFCTLFVITGRVLIWGLQALLRRFNIGVIRLAVVGDLSNLSKILKSLRSTPHSLYRIEQQYKSLDVADIIKQLDADNLDELLIINERYNVEELIRLRNHCIEHQVGFSFVPSLFTELQSSFVIRTEMGLPAVEVQPTPLDGWGRVVKRILDIILSIFFIILFSPLFIIVAIWMKIADPGPLIYTNERLGKNNQPIRVWKFRSMKLEYCDGPGYSGAEHFKKYLAEHPEAAKEWQEMSKLKNDPRVSSVGKFLRKTSLDELPQFFNVFFGTLSIVGPRPIYKNEFNDEVAKYGEAARILFTVKPGLTGLWQVSGRSSLTFAERIKLDIHYIENWNPIWDIWIILKTSSVFLPSKGGKDAY